MLFVNRKGKKSQHVAKYYLNRNNPVRNTFFLQLTQNCKLDWYVSFSIKLFSNKYK